MSRLPARDSSACRRLAYHEISTSEPQYLYGVSSKKFRCAVQRVATLNATSKNALATIGITFDDGHVSQFENALPELEAAFVKATFFVTAGWMSKRSGYMSWPQLSELSALGHDIQAHGWSHVLLTKCSRAELAEELSRSKCELENHLGKKVETLSAPGGRWNEEVLEACARAGYKRIYTSDPWILQQERSGLEMAGRWMVTRKMDENQIERMLAGEGLPILRAKYLLKEAAKKVLGDKTYQSLWRSLSRKNESLERAGEKATSIQK